MRILITNLSEISEVLFTVPYLYFKKIRKLCAKKRSGVCGDMFLERLKTHIPKRRSVFVGF
jgi:hypothetical protein